ncbi:DUF255 domain-containing protein [Streptomyces sp. M19]
MTSSCPPQHADTPVGWWPWTPEAFEEARRRDVPVPRGVGYPSRVAAWPDEASFTVEADAEARPTFPSTAPHAHVGHAHARRSAPGAPSGAEPAPGDGVFAWRLTNSRISRATSSGTRTGEMPASERKTSRPPGIARTSAINLSCGAMVSLPPMT